MRTPGNATVARQGAGQVNAGGLGTTGAGNNNFRGMRAFKTTSFYDRPHSILYKAVAGHAKGTSLVDGLGGPSYDFAE